MDQKKEADPPCPILRITSLFFNKDTDEAKKTWVDSVEKILGIGHLQ